MKCTDNSTTLDVAALRTFCEVVRLRNFTAAANHLHMTAAAVSYRIKMLERNLGVVLFNRTTRSIELTAAGETLLTRAAQILDGIYALPYALQQVSSGIEAHFTISINELLFEPVATATLLAHLHEQYPYTEFKLQTDVYMGVWDAMLQGSAHLAIGAPGFHTINDDFVSTPLGTVDWVFVAAPHHPLATQTSPVSAAMVRAYPAVNVEDTAVHISKRVAWKLPGQQELLVPSMASKIACHIEGVAPGFLPAPLALREFAAGRLVEIKIDFAGRSPSPLALVWRRKQSGQISAALCELFARRADIVLPFIEPLTPVADPA